MKKTIRIKSSEYQLTTSSVEKSIEKCVSLASEDKTAVLSAKGSTSGEVQEYVRNRADDMKAVLRQFKMDYEQKGEPKNFYADINLNDVEYKARLETSRLDGRLRMKISNNLNEELMVFGRDKDECFDKANEVLNDLEKCINNLQIATSLAKELESQRESHTKVREVSVAVYDRGDDGGLVPGDTCETIVSGTTKDGVSINTFKGKLTRGEIKTSVEKDNESTDKTGDREDEHRARDRINESRYDLSDVTVVAGVESAGDRSVYLDDNTLDEERKSSGIKKDLGILGYADLVAMGKVKDDPDIAIQTSGFFDYSGYAEIDDDDELERSNSNWVYD